MKDFNDLISKIWETLDCEIEKCNLINVYHDRIEMIR